MRRTLGYRLGLVALAGLCLAIVAPLSDVAPSGGTAVAGPATEAPNFTFDATSSPATIAPGGSGAVLVTISLRKGVHVYPENLKIMPTEVDGVTYGPPVVKTKTVEYRVPGTAPDDDPEKVWLEKIELEIPYSVGERALFPLRVGASFKVGCCDDEQCYAPVTTKEPILVGIPAPAGWVRPAGAPPAPTDATNPDVAADGGAPTPVGPAALPPRDAPPPPTVPSSGAATEAATSELTLSDQAARVTLKASAKDVTLVFTPTDGYHLYTPAERIATPVKVTGRDAAGIRWRAAVHDIVDGTTIEAPYTVVVAYEGTTSGEAGSILEVRWQGCSDAGGCATPVVRRVELRTPSGGPTLTDLAARAVAAPPTAPVATSASAPSTVPGAGPAVASVPATASSVLPEHGMLFPEIGSTKKESPIERWSSEWGWLFLLPIFGTGILLAFTPCVLPLVPITVSLIGGTNVGELSKGRLSVLLGCYVAGLALAFGSLGLIASAGGSGMAAAFQSPVALWVIAGVFAVLGFGMFGVFELQPPAFLQRLQGGAKGGSPVGAFLLGAMGAVIASPCTGPVIAAMLVFTAESGNTLLGFLMFVSLGLGMGAVFFAAGSLNMILRPGPWMVWVRYAFGVIIVAAALFYLADAGKISPRTLFLAGGGLALLAAVLIQRHLIKKEGEEPGEATKKAAIVGVASALATLGVAMLTRPPTSALTWTEVTSRAQLHAEVEKAKARGVGACFDIWATWCPQCVAYDAYIEKRPELRLGFERIARIRLNLKDGVAEEAGIREAVDAPKVQPYLVFFTPKGEIVSDWRTQGPPQTKETEEKFTDILKKVGALR